MNRRVSATTHVFEESQCCVCDRSELAQYTNVRGSCVSIKGKLSYFTLNSDLISIAELLGEAVPYLSILESTLNFKDDNPGDILDICEACKETIVSFFLLKQKFKMNQPRARNEHQDPFSATAALPEPEFNKSIIIKKEHFDDDCSDFEDQPAVKLEKPGTGTRTGWLQKQSFPSHKEAFSFIKSKKIWSIKQTKEPSKKGERRRYYRCNLVPKTGKQCSAVILLRLQADGVAVMFCSKSGHSHNQIHNST